MGKLRQIRGVLCPLGPDTRFYYGPEIVSERPGCETECLFEWSDVAYVLFRQELQPRLEWVGHEPRVSLREDGAP